MTKWVGPAFGLVIAGTLLGSGTARAVDGPLDRYRWTSRVLVISAPDAAGSALAAQRAILAERRSGLRERDLVVLEAVGGTAEARRLRDALGLPEDAFRVVLIGKDGEAKRIERAPLSARALFETIDAMPMRRDETRR